MKEIFLLKNIKSKVFNKLMIIYISLIICAVSILIYLILLFLTHLINGQTLDFNAQVIKTVSNYFYLQCESFKNNEIKIYSTNAPHYDINTRTNDVFDLLDNNYDIASPDYIEKYRTVSNFLRPLEIYGNDYIQDIYLTKKDLSWNMRLSLNSQHVVNNYAFIKENIETDRDNIIKISIIPAFQSNRGYSYAFKNYVRDQNGSICGYLVYVLNTEGIRQSYLQFDKYLVGPILVITPDGKVVYDSSNEYYGKTVPFYSKMSGLKNGTFVDGNSTVSFTSDNTFGFITVGIIPNGTTYKSVNLLKNKIIFNQNKNDQKFIQFCNELNF